MNFPLNTAPRRFIPRNFEGVFLAVVMVLGVVSFSLSELPRQAGAEQASAVVQDTPVQVVVVKGKRLTAAEKASMA